MSDGTPTNDSSTTTARIDVPANGPLLVRGTVTINTPDGPKEMTDPALCRCGASRNKPFCDGSHVSAGFAHDGKGGTGRVDEIGEARPLAITPAPNSPLLTKGPCEVYDADGNLIFRGEKAALCRCGASANKPFCDGAHSKIGFTT